MICVAGHTQSVIHRLSGEQVWTDIHQPVNKESVSKITLEPSRRDGLG